MASKFAQGEQCLFPTREIAIDFLDTMLTHKFFHRAKKVPVSDAELRRGKKPADKDKSDDEKTVKKRQTADKSKDDKASADDTETGTNAESTKPDKPAEKKKRKIRLDMHPDQVFVDGAEAYVWIYDPIPMHYWLFGALVVVGAIVVCLFPLWPPIIRKVKSRSKANKIFTLNNIDIVFFSGCLLFEHRCRWFLGIYSWFGRSPIFGFLHCMGIDRFKASSLDFPESNRRCGLLCIILATLHSKSWVIPIIVTVFMAAILRICVLNS